MSLAKLSHIAAFVALAVVLFAAVLGPQAAPYDPNAIISATGGTHVAAPHWLGLDGLNRDVLSRWLWGTRQTLGEALVAVIVALGVGGAMGLLAFLGGPAIDQIASYLFDLLLVFPSLLLALLLLAVFGPGAANIAIAVGISLSAQVGRVLRRSVILTSHQGYIEASLALGAGRVWVIRRHLLRNIAGSVAALFTVTFAWSLVSTVTLDFLGLSGDISTPTWGNMISEGRLTLREAPMAVAAPMIGILLSVASLSTIADMWASGRNGRRM